MVRLCSMVVAGGVVMGSVAAMGQTGSSQGLSAVPFTHVEIDDGFWRPRLEINRRTTVRYCFEKCEETGRIDNFAKAGGLTEGPHIGHRYDDSDVFKVIEGAAYSLAVKPDPELEAYVDALIEKISAAQEEDGYLFTTRTIDPANPAKGSGDERWSYVAQSHELYNAGHLYEAAVAYHQATGKRALLDVAIRNADLIASEFGPGRRQDPPGHQEIEIGLVKLARHTGERRYFELARFFLNARGREGAGRKLYGQYSQDHLPVTEQGEPVGHAVRAMYQYCGMADVAAATGDAGYMTALDRIWNNMVRTRLYLTGGVGARHSGEAFGDEYELPNGSAYNETCAAIGNALWNHRMALLHRDAKYIDVLERVIYNGFLSGVSLSGDRFFYPNPLASAGTYHRSEWFSCSCCPVNVVRFVPSMAGYVYANDERAAYVNLYMGGSGRVELPGNAVSLRQETAYPWDGAVRIVVEPEREGAFDLMLRVPGWALGRPVPSDLYSYIGEGGARADEHPGVQLWINGEQASLPRLERGYARLSRVWKRGDEVQIHFDMPVRFVRAKETVEADRGRVALERGPVVYCFEAVDNGGHVRDLWLPIAEEGGLRFEPEHLPDLLGGVTVLRGEGRRAELPGANGDAKGGSTSVPVTAVPYAVWEHRTPGEMAVWLAATPALAEPVPPPTLASTSRVTASHCHGSDAVGAVNDLREPRSSGDHSIPRFTWWGHKGTKEWIQYELAAPREISGVDVYWFDDTGDGGCRVPESWRVLVKRADGTGAPQWEPVPLTAEPGVERDVYNRLGFDPVMVSGVRLEVKLQDGYSGGILEWRLH